MRERAAITVNLDPDIKKILEHISKSKHRSATATVRMLIEDYCLNPARLEDIGFTPSKKIKSKMKRI